MDRRTFLSVMSGGVLTAPLVAEAQQMKGRTIGVLMVQFSRGGTIPPALPGGAREARLC